MPEPEGLIPLDETDLPGSFTPIITVAQDEAPEPSVLDKIDSEFDPKYRDDFIGLLYLGRLEDKCVVAGHTFRLLTPGQEDRLSMGAIHKPYANTVVGEQAWRAITVAAYLQEIDGEQAPVPLNSNQPAVAVRFRWVVNSIHSDLMIARIFDEIMLLDAKVRELIDVLDDLGEASA